MSEKIGPHRDAKQTSRGHADASGLDEASFHGAETTDGFAALQEGEVGMHFVGGSVSVVQVVGTCPDKNGVEFEKAAVSVGFVVLKRQRREPCAILAGAEFIK
jgi:hypothetical protein